MRKQPPLLLSGAPLEESGARTSKHQLSEALCSGQ